MGCDIHTFVEVKVGDKWHLYNQPETPRDYALFEKMAGVRGEPENAIAQPRGIPTDVSEMTKICYDYDGVDAHTPSYLLQHEIAVIAKWMDKQPNMDIFSIYKYFGFVFGNGFDLENAEEDIPIDAVRLVFWFDN